MRRIRFTKAKHKLIKPYRNAAKGGMLDRLNGYLSQEDAETVMLLLHNLEGLPNTMTYKELREAFLAGGISQAYTEHWQKEYSKIVDTVLRPRWEQAAEEAAQEAKNLYPDFLYEPSVSAATAWIKDHGAEFVTNLALEQVSALNAMIGYASGYTAVTPDEVARMMRPCIGLTKPQAIANLRYRETVKDAYLKAHPRGKPETAEKKAADAAARYAARQHRYRAQSIARTELAYGYNAGHHGATKDAQAQGYIGDCRKKWLTAYDERVCNICGSMDGETVGMDDEFSAGVQLPPAHPQCRCAVAYEEIEGTNLMPRADQSDEKPFMEVVGTFTGNRYEDQVVPDDMITPISQPINTKASLLSFANDGTMTNMNSNRNMAMGMRKPASHILTENEIESLEADRKAIGIPDGIVLYNKGDRTGFRDFDAKIVVRGDVLPDTESTIARDRMSSRAVLAHEFYGHYANHPSEYDLGDWRDEYRASRQAALTAPNLTDQERADLIVDAYDRAREAGQFMEYDEEARELIYGI